MLLVPRSPGLVLAGTRKPSMGRRGFLGWGGAAAAAGILVPFRPGRAATCAFKVGPYCADPTGQTDSSQAFQAALDSIASQGNGVFQVPRGIFRLDSPLVSQNASVTIRGAGQAESILRITHTGTAWAHTCTNKYQHVEISDIGFSPTPTGGGPAGTCLSLNWPSSPSGWCGPTIDNVDIGVAHPGYTCFTTGVSLSNSWRGQVNNLNSHSNIGAQSGSVCISLSGECIDNRFTNMSLDGYDTSLLLNNYSEGIHVIDSVIYGNHGISTGTTSYSGNGQTSPLINLLGLYVARCEFATQGTALELYQVDSGWISSSQFQNSTPGQAAVTLMGSTAMQISGCQFTGHLNAGTSPFVGIALSTSSAGWSAGSNQIDKCEFSNLTTGILLGGGCINNTGSGNRMLAYGGASLVGNPQTNPNGALLSALMDNSGNSTNLFEWLASADAINSKSGRFLYEQP
jgi:hypothetical protein